MPAPIVLGDTSGLAEGITAAGSALGQALQTRAKNLQEKQKKEKTQAGIQASADWIQNYDESRSPGENLSTLQKALKESGMEPAEQMPIIKGMVEKIAGTKGEEFQYNQMFPNDVSPDVVENMTPREGDDPAETPPPPAVTRPNVMANRTNDQLVQMSAHPNKTVAKAATAEIEKRKLEQRINNDDRDWHSKFSIDQEKKVSALREAVPKKNAALSHARRAVQSGKTGMLTGNFWADVTGIEAFRDVAGAQLEVAAKEHFFGNMSRVSAKAQNIFFEKLLKNMFAQVGQTEETAMAFNELLQAEVNTDDAFVREFDRLSEQDEARFGYPRKDVERRARQSVEHLEEVNLNRSLYRIQMLEEAQESKSQARKNLDKPVPEGTPLTLERKFQFLDKYNGDSREAIKAIKKLGYRIPNASEVNLYMMPNREFMERMGGE